MIDLAAIVKNYTGKDLAAMDTIHYPCGTIHTDRGGLNMVDVQKDRIVIRSKGTKKVIRCVA